MLPRVVIVDDSEADRVLMQRAAGLAGVAEDVVSLTGGEQLIPFLIESMRSDAEAGRQPRPTLVLLDIHMPGRNGFEVLEDLARRLAGGPADPLMVMMFTGSDDSRDRARAMQFEFVKDYLIKPIDARSLRAVVTRHFAQAGAAR
jgi:CheY-like chemotaxis protein